MANDYRPEGRLKIGDGRSHERLCRIWPGGQGKARLRGLVRGVSERVNAKRSLKPTVIEFTLLT